MAATRNPGERVGGRYQVRALVGERPLGTLYRAYDEEIGVEVALRLISAGLLPDLTARDGFMRKLGRGRGLQHKNLVRLFGVALDGEEVAVATQWVLGPTLRERIDQRPRGGAPLTRDSAQAVLRQVRAAMAHAHSLGVVLGDVRAETVLELDDAIKVTNIGIGPALPRKRYLEAMRGSHAWARLAPEIRAGLLADARADVYSLALLAYELLCGAVPDPTPRPSAQVPPSLVLVIERALSDDPLLRPATVDALGHEIERALRVSASSLIPLRPAAWTGEDTNPDAAAAAPSGGDDYTQKTRQVSEEELRRLSGKDETRRASEEEIFPLRVESADEVSLEMEVPFEEELQLEAQRAPDGTWRGPLPEREEEEPEGETQPVLLLEPDAAHTVPVRKVDPEGLDTVPVPRVAAIEFGDEAIETQRVEKLAPADAQSLAEQGDDDEEETGELDISTDPAAVERFLSTAPRTPPVGAPRSLPGAGRSSNPARPTPPIAPPPPIANSSRASAAPAAPASTANSGRAAAAPSTPASSPKSGRAISAPAAPAATANSGRASATPTAPASTANSGRAQAAPTAQASSANSGRAAAPAAPASTGNSGRATSPPFPAPPPRAPVDDLPKIEIGELAPFPPPRAPEPAAPAQPMPKRRSQLTQTVSPLTPPPSRKSPAAAWVTGGIAAALVIGLAIAAALHLRGLRLDRDRAETQRLADALNARADALRHGAPPASPPPIAPAPEKSQPKIAAEKLPQKSANEKSQSKLPTEKAAAPTGPCPLGANLVDGRFCVDLYEYPGGKTIPRTDVSFTEAARLCGLRGERLCSDSEWERACRGKHGASYPYGQSFDATRCNTKGGGGELAPAGTFSSCRSASGAYDMSGNVAEWVSHHGAPAQKGGSAVTGNPQARCSNIVRGAIAEGAPFVGFRCCSDPTQ